MNVGYVLTGKYRKETKFKLLKFEKYRKWNLISLYIIMVTEVF